MLASDWLVMVINDLMEEVSNSKTAMDIFTKHSHHKNMTVLFLVQKLYGRTHNTRVVSQNAHLMVLFKKPKRRIQCADIRAPDVPRKPQVSIQPIQRRNKETPQLSCGELTSED